MLDLYICQASSLTDLGHCTYELRHCATCAGAYAACAVCPSLGELCPGCRHRTVLAQIAAGKVVFPDVGQVSRPGESATAVGSGQADLAVDHAGAVGELLHGTVTYRDIAQAATVDAGSTAVYNPAMVSFVEVAPALGAVPVATHTSPLVLLVLPVDLAGVLPVLEALAPVIAPQAMNGHQNGHQKADGQRLPRLPRKTYLSDTPCPHGHTYQDSGKVLRYLGSHMCTQCAAQSKPRAKAPAATEG
jgi:hypothetical protein